MLKYSKSHPDDYFPFVYLAAAYGHLGREQEAKSAVETYGHVRTVVLAGPDYYSEYSTGANLLEQVSIYRLKDGGVEEQRLREGLRKAGFDPPPEVMEASPQGITLNRPARSAIARLYQAANEHCGKHGRKSHLMHSSPARYVFSCQ